MNTYLLIDSPYLAHRAFYTTGGLSFNGQPTGVIYGFLRELVRLNGFFPGARPVFAFDSPPYLRSHLSSTYKTGISETPEKQNVRKEIQQLCKVVLPIIGYGNTVAIPGYEADDIIASVAISVRNGQGDKATIVSADQDLYQCLSPDVSMWSPAQKKLYTYSDFYSEYSITPDRWWEVKALAGCGGDGVIGLNKVGDKTAARYLRGEIKEGSKLWYTFKGSSALKVRNGKLVRLPFAGCPVIPIKDDSVTVEKWHALANKLGMNSLLGLKPVGMG